MRNFAAKLALVAVVIGGAGATASRYLYTSPAVASNEVDANWRPTRNTINERPVSAEDLDAQQPSSPSIRTSGPVAREAPAAGIGSSWSYRNCREARAAGTAPIYRGQPGYGAHMDGDGDGIACEPYVGKTL